MSFIIVIPARYASTRFPGKPLININGKSMIRCVLDRARESGADRIIVATDHEEVANEVKKSGGEVCMTLSNHQSGIERIAEVIEKYNFLSETVIINIQGDEPIIQSGAIRHIAESLEKLQVGMVTLAVPIYNVEEVFNTNIVKVIMNAEKFAIYFSRAPIPWDRNRFSQYEKKIIDNTFFRHIGIYGYRADFIRHYINWKPSPLEKIEMLEQLRVIWYGERIYVKVVQESPGISVDTPEDLSVVQSKLRNISFT